jgi:hypothetical protein
MYARLRRSYDVTVEDDARREEHTVAVPARA